jgi:hypothetical protein
MQASRPKQIERAAAVWVWDGSWWPAMVTGALIVCGERLLIVRFEHGLTAPARPANLEPRDPGLRGADKPSLAVARQYASAESEKKPT